MKKTTIITLITISLIFLQSCIGHSGNSDRPAPTPYNDYLPAMGNVDLFENEYAEAIDTELKSLNDDVELEQKNKLNFQNLNQSSALDVLRSENTDKTNEEPRLDYVLLKKVSKCQLPKLNYHNKTMLSALDFQIYSLCILDVLPKDSLGAKQYPDLPAMNTKGSAYRFMRVLLDEYMAGYHLADIDNATKFAIFERLFLVTKFRSVSTNEKILVEKLIQNKGLYYTSRMYLVNWYISYFYQNHLDFSKNPSGKYKSIQISGKLLKDNNLLNQANFQVLNDSTKGFHSKGITNNDSNLLDVLGLQNNENFLVQVYIPHNSFSQLDKTGLNVLFTSKQGDMFVYKAKTDDFNKQNREVHFTLMQNDWSPDAVPSDNEFLSFDFTVNQGQKFHSCDLPKRSTVDAQIIDGYDWQKVAYCLNQFSPFNTKNGLNYYSLTDKMSAYDYMSMFVEKYIHSYNAIEKTEIDLINHIYNTLTFRDMSEAMKSSVQKSLNKKSIESVADLLLEAWFFSQTYKTSFDYSKSPYSGMTWKTIEGAVVDVDDKKVTNTPIVLTNYLGEKLKETITDKDGKYKINVLLADVYLSQKFYLKSQSNIYVESKSGFVLSTNEHYNVPLKLAILGQAEPNLASEIKNGEDNISIVIPKGAVEERTHFELSELEVKTKTRQVDGEDISENYYEFSVSPSYQFKKPVKMTIALSDSMLADVDNSASTYALFYKDDETGKLHLLNDSSFSPDNKTMSATTTHFSTFILGNCLILQCGTVNMVDPMATVLERRHLEYPTQLPALIQHAKSLLTAGGWSTSKLDNIKLSKNCNDDSCMPIIQKLTKYDLNLPSSYSKKSGFAKINIDKIEILDANIKATAHLDVQAEKCTINKLASLPQIRLNSIHSINADLDIKLNFKNVELSYVCKRTKRKCKNILFLGRKCINIPYISTCKERFSHTLTVQVRNYKKQIRRTNDLSKIHFYSGITSSEGKMNVFTNIQGYLSAAKRKYLENIKKIIKKRLNVSKEKINSKILEKLNRYNIKDPVFNESNCFEAGAPTVSILGFSNGNMVANANGNFIKSGAAFHDSTVMSWQSNRKGSYKIGIGESCDNLLPVLETGEVEKGETKETTIYGSQIHQNGLNELKVCITDKYNGETGFDGQEFYKIYKPACQTKTRIVSKNICKQVPYQYCYRVKTGSKHRGGCWNYFGCHCRGWTACYVATYSTRCETRYRTECNCQDVNENYTQCYDYTIDTQPSNWTEL